MKAKILIIHLASTAVLLSIFVIMGGARHIFQVLLGSVLIGINFQLILWVTNRLINKKSVALASVVIVLKYTAILGAFVYFSSLGIEIGAPFAVGVSAVIPTIIYLAYQYMMSNEENGSL